MSSAMGSALLGASTFHAKQHGADECDVKGLPLTLNSINAIGRFQALKQLQHSNLCAYLDLIKAKNERLIVVAEYYDDCLGKYTKTGEFSDPRTLARLAYQVLQGLAYLNRHGITHRALSADNILLTPEGVVKLHNYGLYHMTKHGKYINFSIGSPRYLAPETIMSGPGSKTRSGPKVDVWSLGIILLELFMGTPLYPDLFLKNGLPTLFKRIALLVQNYQRNCVTPVSAILEAHGCSDKPMDTNFSSFIEACLSPLPSKRPTPAELLTHPLFDRLEAVMEQKLTPNGYVFLPSPFTTLVRAQNLQLPSYQVPSSSSQLSHDDHLTERPLRDVYYLWSLAGGDVEMELRKRKIIQSRPPINALPALVIHEGENYGMGRDRVTLYDQTVYVLSLDQLRKRLQDMTTEDYYPLLEKQGLTITYRDGETSSSIPEPHESSTLPLAIKEKDVEYQFHRMIILSRLLESYPFTRDQLVTEALTDVCPLLRGEVWAALLGVKGDCQSEYTAIDKDTEIPTDRQIAVDIPRCHQYHPLLASAEGHRKFKRVLKSWVVFHRQLVYWQGLDSLCAPFLVLNFTNEALVHACLSAFIDKYLYNFFLKDNSPIMQEYLAVFSHMIAFHDPELFNHLDSVAFIPELFAIPWFLTMFTHIMPVNKIFHLWDTMLLGNSTFPLCVGVAILNQLRDSLLSFDFNECILMFSDMPEIDIQQCVQMAVRVFEATPPSACVRLHEHTPIQPSSIPPETRREPLPLAALKMESCPQISAHDLITLCRLEAMGYTSHHVSQPHPLTLARNLTKKTPGKKKKRALIVDIRSYEEFRSGHVPNSLNLPHSTTFQPDGSLTPCPAATLLTNHRGRVTIVVGHKGDTGPIFARQLVRLNFPKVCVLHGGVGVLRSLGLLCSIQDDP